MFGSTRLSQQALVCPRVQGRPWVRMVVVGQSFMLHQIRKMVGLAVAMARGVAADYVMHAALGSRHSVHVPMAPEPGLFLERCFFEAYNDKWSHTHGEDLDVGLYADQVEDFKVGFAQPAVLMFTVESCMPVGCLVPPATATSGLHAFCVLPDFR